ncbi:MULTISPECIES: hypothetical protein [Legionella]|uniref:Uncharacterized protein n=1 Tax=Legionella sainthelensi TaxID=28087 RepID=A0A0W0YBX9_9GAMM|nr:MULTISPECIES: hypothetical protein [Legionella]HAT9162379.1 hypothetical protein [Legionella pneumophila subsp. pneumophila]KTD54258.1 hypothetical protein Lsai_3080 [Legionella sainthelensi]QRN03539.1 hypothetical protein GH742_06490 [Legionella sp. MW5194]VEH30002.1 Uncharacterised protein [Legionella sainthelensi]GAN26159.1 hypothetical protein lpymg_01041 [Legionella pneumophila]
MSHDYKVGIYKGIIQYLLDATNYSLQRIANLSNSPIAYLQLIYHHNRLPQNRNVELNLLKLFVLFIDMEIKRERSAEKFLLAEMG